jgi:peptide/nickel transport system ATP-binding protein
MMVAPVLQANGVVKHFSAEPGLSRLLRRARVVVHAVDGADVEIRAGEVVGLVGESGSGKTTLARVIAGLERSTSGQVTFDGRDIAFASGREFRLLRQHVQVVFQDAAASLSPRRRIETLLVEPYKIHRVPEAARIAPEMLLDEVGLGHDVLVKFPHELSGGQARRVSIARALALRPRLLVADEPTTGLDVSTAAGVLNLLRELATTLHLAMLVITHDLGTLASLADRILVMYLGQIVEAGTATQVLHRPAHPYTRALISAVALPSTRASQRRIVLRGDVPSPTSPPSGCRFRSRCPWARDHCSASPPDLRTFDSERLVRCHFAEEISAEQTPP